MKLSKIFYNPIALLLISFLLSIYTTYSYQFLSNVFGQILSFTFIYYLLICFVNDVQLVLRKILPWYIPFIIPIFGLFGITVMSFGSELNVVSNFIIGLSIIGFGHAAIAMMMNFQARTTYTFIRDNLSDYLTHEELAIPHIMAYRKYFFKDFTAIINRMKTVGTKEAKRVASDSTLLRPTKGQVASGTALEIGAKVLEKQIGNPEGYMFDIYIEKDLNNEYVINEPGLSNVKKVFRRGKFDDQKLRTLAREIDSQVEENIAVVYFTRHPSKHTPILKLVINPDYFETEPQKVYLFISALKSRI